jgi:hypothetical protein
MASSEHPQTSPGTKVTPAEIPSVPLPPLPRTPTVDAMKFLRQRSRLDALLVAVVLLFAFLVVSFPTTNTDFFRHAAIGRLLLQGEYHFGVDPFVYAAGTSYFVNHSWLFDLLLYGLYQLPDGGAIIVILKALLTLALAMILLLAGRRAGQSLWIPALCTALAILVVSPRLYFYVQSVCLSFLFLGVTVWLLTAAGAKEKQWWLLPPLFALWVNCDSWFFLGPLTVVLYLLGGLLQQHWGSFSFSREPEASAAALASGSRLNEKNSRLRTLGLVLGVGVAACLLNPHHVRALTLPPELGLTAAGDMLEQDPQFSALFLSPLSKNYYQPYTGLSAAGLAYWPLLLLGLASFAVVFNRVSWPRLLVWSGFALMSLYNWRTIPFFAIVAGPITAANWLDFVAQRLGTEPRLTRAWRSWAVAGRVLTLLLGLALLIATVPGWLQKSQPTFYRIGWGVHVDPSLQEMAEAIHGWRQDGLLPDQPNWFNMHLEVANYLAWFAPGERVFLDQSLMHFREAAADYLAIRKGLEQEVEQDIDAVKTDWKKILDDHHVHFWIYDNIAPRKADLVSRLVLFTGTDEWTLCYLKGRIAIFAKRDRQAPASGPSTRLALDVKRSAFGPEAEKAPPRGGEPAPPREWWQMCWDLWWHPDPPQSSAREVLPLYDYCYQSVEKPRQIYTYSRVLQAAVAASGIAGSVPGGPVPSNLLTLSWSCTYNDLFPAGAVQPTRQVRKSEEAAIRLWASYVGNQFLESPSLYLAVRAARRALLVDAEDGPTYFRLGQMYQRLRDLPQESQLRRLPSQAAPPLIDALRRAQMIAALHNSLRFQIDDEKAAEAHEALYQVYGRELGYIDVAVRHLRLAYDKRTVLPPPSGMSPTQYSQGLERMYAQLTQLDSDLGRRLDRYDVNAASKSGLEKVQAALQEGLSETALTLLEQEPVDLGIASPAQMMLIKVLTSMILDLGRLDKAQQLLPDLEGQPVKPEDLELYLRLAAARGDYAEADRLLDDALRYVGQWQPGVMRMPEPVTLVAPQIGQILLAEARHLMGSPCVPWVPNNLTDIIQRPWLSQNSYSEFWRRRLRLEAIISGLIAVRQQGEWEFMRGWLALEAGDCVEARKHFQTARDLAVQGQSWAPEVDRLNAWFDPQQEVTRLQQLGFRHAILYDYSTHYLNLLKEEQIPDPISRER